MKVLFSHGYTLQHDMYDKKNYLQIVIATKVY